MPAKTEKQILYCCYVIYSCSYLPTSGAIFQKWRDKILCWSVMKSPQIFEVIIDIYWYDTKGEGNYLRRMNAIRNFSACNGMIQLLYLTKASMQDTILEDVKELLIDCMMSDKSTARSNRHSALSVFYKVRKVKVDFCR